MTDHTANKASLRTLIDRLAEDSDYKTPPKILRRDLLVIFLYLDDRLPVKKRRKELEISEKKQNGERIYDETSESESEEEEEDDEDDDEGDDESDDGSEEGSGTYESDEEDDSAESKLYTSWTDWFELIAKITMKFPYYLGTMKSLCGSRSHNESRPDDSRRHKWLKQWVDAFVHYEAPFQRRVYSNGLSIEYRVNMNDAVQYLRESSHLPSPIKQRTNASGATLLTLPPEVRAMIWKLVVTYPNSGVLFQADDNKWPPPHMYTISRDLNSKGSIECFLEETLDNHYLADCYFTEHDQIVSDVSRSRMITNSMRKVFAPMTINKNNGEKNGEDNDEDNTEK